MSNLNDISMDKIETDLMSVLYANMDYTFTQYSLFNKLLNDKYDITNTNSAFISSNFKSKFLLILRNLMSKYDDIKITRDDTIFNIVCLSSPDAKPIKFTNSLKDTKSNNVQLDENDISGMYDYIWENNPNEYYNWNDPFDGNSIFHELVLNNNTKQIERLIGENLFDYSITNNHKQTPVDLIKTPQVAKILTLGLIKNLTLTKEKLITEKENVNMLVKNFNDKINFYESDEYKNKIINETKLFDILFIKTKKYHFAVKMYLISSIICYLSIKLFF